MHFVCWFIFFTQFGIISRGFLYAGANPACSNNIEQKIECVLLFLKIEEIVHILESSMIYLVFRKVRITMINELQFLERIYNIYFLRNIIK